MKLSFSKLSTICNVIVYRSGVIPRVVPTPSAVSHCCPMSTETRQSPADDHMTPWNTPASSVGATPITTPTTSEPSLEYPLTAPSSHTSPSFMNDPLSMKFINCMMRDGKKSVSQTIFRKALEIVKTSQLKKLHSKQTTADSKVTMETDPLVVFHTAIKHVTPILGVKSVKRGGKVYQVPTPLPENRRRFLSIKWLITAARERPGPRRTMKMPERLAAEMLDAYNNEGTAVKRKQDMNRLAEANRAFVHFRW